MSQRGRGEIKTVFFGAALCAAAGVAHAQWSTELWSSVRLAPTGASSVNQNGQASSTFVAINAGGQITGRATRYSAGFSNGEDGWVWSASEGFRIIGNVVPNPVGPDGYKLTTPQIQAEDGRIAGIASDYTGLRGEIAWLRRPDGTTASMLLDDAEHTGSIRNSAPLAFGPQDLLVGWSRRAGSLFDNGHSVWAWRPQMGVLRLGYFDAAHTKANGYRETAFSGLLDSGVVVGTSVRAVGHPNFIRDGMTAWAWDPVEGQRQIGLQGVGYVYPPTGYQHSEIKGVIPSGVIAGMTELFIGNSYKGSDAWVYTPGSGTQTVGLTGPGYTGSDGSRASNVIAVSPAGVVGGRSSAYSASGSFLTNDIWAWDASLGTVRIGFYDSTHTHLPDMAHESTLVRVYNNGWMAGTSRRFPYLPNDGKTAWVWTREGGTQRIGFFDADHTLPSGSQISDVVNLGDGCVFGTSARNVAGNPNALTNWVWTPRRGTHQVGLTGGVHGGTYFTTSNRRGQVVGQTTRTQNGSSLGMSGWFYDPGTNTVTPLIFSTQGDSAYTVPTLLTDDGVVVGVYLRYEGAGSSMRGFVWSLDRGFLDVGDVLPGGVPNAEVSTFGEPYAALGRNVVFRTSRTVTSNLQEAPLLLIAPTLFDLCGPADLGGAGGVTPGDGQLDNNDFIAFINLFFSTDIRADCGASGGLPGSDGQLDNNDFIVFISQFFSGC